MHISIYIFIEDKFSFAKSQPSDIHFFLNNRLVPALIFVDLAREVEAEVDDGMDNASSMLGCIACFEVISP